MSPSRREIIVPIPHVRGKVPLATDVRSTLVLGSLQSLRTHGLFDRYVARVDDAVRDTILGSAAGVWLPMHVGVAHYQACEALDLALEDQIAIGREVGNRIQGSFLGLFVRTAKNAGVTPWNLLRQLDRLWERVFQGGGGPQVTKLGPKEARVELIGLPLLTVPYFRHAYRGTFLAGIELFSNKVYVQETGLNRTAPVACYRISWA